MDIRIDSNHRTHQYCRKTGFLFWGVVMVAFFFACRGNPGKSTAKDTSNNAVRVDNQRFFEVMKPYLNEGYTVKMVPTGISMLPTIHDNADVVMLKEVKQVKSGDIVLAEIEKGHYVMHRVVRVEGAYLTLKGDNNRTMEKACLADVLAKVISINKGEAKTEGRSIHEKMDVTDIYRKIKSFRLDTKGAATIMVDTVCHMVDMQHVITFNETAMTVWRQIENLDGFTIKKMVEIVTNDYDIDKQKATYDCKGLLQEWMELGLVEGVSY